MLRKFNPIWQQIAVKDQHWRQLIAKRELVLEIGAGVGLHPIQFAKNNPDKFIVAMERTTDKFAKFKRSCELHKLDNLLALHTDAVQWIYQNIQPQEVLACYVLYPNPYPKLAQANKRIMHMPFFSYLLDCLKLNAKFILATNENFFIQEAYARMLTWSDAYMLELSNISVNAEFNGRTHFERKYLARHQECQQLVATRIK